VKIPKHTTLKKEKELSHTPAFVKTTAGQGAAENAEKRKEEGQNIRRLEGQKIGG